MDETGAKGKRGAKVRKDAAVERRYGEAGFARPVPCSLQEHGLYPRLTALCSLI